LTLNQRQIAAALGIEHLCDDCPLIVGKGLLQNRSYKRRQRMFRDRQPAASLTC